ncbi:DUF4176 domain-containing protein [Lactococcus nasutitermitis]|uniref:DUF4176 domain-containing protein n=1 Tax=Lactococcus nasutitermitis TaxID=1652957 RepID=A0ABV9JFI8_9LACT|nr:DUF4176 domain-containing protein [Lactococcus nasutitermitis]
MTTGILPLPLGSVVTVKTNTQKLMIIGRAQLFKQNGITGYFDYSAVLYPIGSTGADKFAFFNHEDISETIFKGYYDEQEIEFESTYQEIILKSNYSKLHVKLDDTKKEKE